MAKFYAWDPDDYSQSSSAQFAWAIELIEKLALRGDEHVLDIGCGDGKVSAEIAKRVPGGSVFGIDSSGDMIRHAKDSFPLNAYPNLDFSLRDARNINFSAEFDAVFSNAALHWVKDQKPVLAGIRQSLRAGGKMLCSMGGRGNAEVLISIVTAMTESQDWSRYFEGFVFPWGFFSPEEYLPWLETAGLFPKRVELVFKDMTQQGHDGLASWIRTTWLPYTDRVPVALREDFIRELVDNYIFRHPLDKNGFVHVDMFRLEVEAVWKNI